LAAESPEILARVAAPHIARCARKEARMETETGRRFCARSDTDGRIVEIRGYRRYSEPFTDVTTGRRQRIPGPEILRIFPTREIVEPVEGDPKAYKIADTDEIVREI
jgi:hypothetical protein